MPVNAVLEVSTEHIPAPPFMLELITGLHHEKLTSAQRIKYLVYWPGYWKMEWLTDEPTEGMFGWLIQILRKWLRGSFNESVSCPLIHTELFSDKWLTQWLAGLFQYFILTMFFY